MFDFATLRRNYPWILAGMVGISFLLCLPKLLEWTNEEEYQVLEYPNGTIRVLDTPGFHLQLFGEVFSYPRYVDAHFSEEGDESVQNDATIRVTFNDGGWGYTSHHLKYQMPIIESQRIKLHQHFGAGGVDAVTEAVGHHLRNCLKNSGPLMSGSEHQAQRTAEFYQVVSSQLVHGLYVMERVEKKIDRKIDRILSSEPETQYYTRIRRDKDEKPIIAAPSPLTEFGIGVGHYNQTKTEYDDDTLAQINAKRESYQLAEQAKAATLNEQQKLLEVIEKGKLAVASVQAEENKTKKEVLVKANQEQDVARIAQKETVTIAEQAVAVAGEQKKMALTKLDISVIKIEQAKAEADKLLAESHATKAKLEQGGALSERDQVMAEMRKQRSAAIAEAISQIHSPKIAILGGGNGKSEGSAASTTETLMNLIMLRQLDGSNKAKD